MHMVVISAGRRCVRRFVSSADGVAEVCPILDPHGPTNRAGTSLHVLPMAAQPRVRHDAVGIGCREPGFGSGTAAGCKTHPARRADVSGLDHDTGVGKLYSLTRSVGTGVEHHDHLDRYRHGVPRAVDAGQTPGEAALLIVRRYDHDDSVHAARIPATVTA